MQLFEWLLVLLLGAVLLVRLARRIRVPYPSLLALGGAGLALVPGGPRILLDPDLTLALLVAPVLLDAAFDTSVRDIRTYWRAVVSAALGAVIATTIAVAIVLRIWIPDMPWHAAIALGALVAPPDASAATAILRSVAPPHRLVVILEGESLLNDASALLIYRLAILTFAAGGLSAGSIAITVARVTIGGIVAGLALAWIARRTLTRIDDPPSAIVVQFVSTFGVWLLAERLGLSPIVTVVTYAVTLARFTPGITPARLRIPSYAVWDTATFVLNVLAFTLIGLQVRPILEGLSSAQRTTYIAVALGVLATVIVIRFVWVMGYVAIARGWRRLRGDRMQTTIAPPSWRGGMVVSWSGMRGVVTLAGALALPRGGVDGAHAFPYRDLIVLAAFTVVIGTLVLQGLTLRPLLRRLSLHDDDPVGREVQLARTAALAAAIAALDGDRSPEAEPLRAAYAAARARSMRGEAGALPENRLRLRALAAARSTVIELRSRGDLGDDAFHRIEEELDWLELSATLPE